MKYLSILLIALMFCVTCGQRPTSDSKNEYKPIPHKPAEPIDYYGNVNTKKFHKPDCYYYDCDNCTRRFETYDEAIEAGYEPCKKCNPSMFDYTVGKAKEKEAKEREKLVKQSEKELTEEEKREIMGDPKMTLSQLQDYDLKYIATCNEDDLIIHTGYTLCYSENHEQALWVAYRLTDEMINGTFKRKNDFREDPLVKTGSATLTDYEGSNYHRGHLCPAKDMQLTANLVSETFFMSNMSPQVGSFNQGIWKTLENKVRKWTEDNKAQIIVTGGILTDDLPTIGENKVSVPKYYYKIVVDYTEPEIKTISFILENAKSKDSLDKFAVTIDDIEKQTSLDFFYKLYDDSQERLESSVDRELWF